MLNFNKDLPKKAVILAALVVSSFTLSAQAKDFTAANNSIPTELCLTALSGNRAAMHNKITSSGYSKTYIAKNLQCNGENIVSFIAQNGRNSEKMLKILDRKGANVSITDLAMNSPKQ